MNEPIDHTPIEAWRSVWRKGICPQISNAGLLALEQALEEDDPALLQGATTSPPPLNSVSDWPVEAACLLGYCAWKGDRLEQVGDVAQAFATACFKCDQELGEPAGSRWLLNWFDDTPRGEMIANLLPEVRRSLLERGLAVRGTKELAEAVSCP